jgi:uncharacterized membrane protein
MNALKAKPWAVLALISLALNLFLGGLLAGRLLRPDRRPWEMGPISLFRATKDLDPGSREIVDRVRDKHRGNIRDTMGRAASARVAAVEALCAEQFDEAKAREAFQAFRKEMGGAQDEMHESLLEVAKEMTPAQRTKLKQVLLRGRKGRRSRPHGSMAPFLDGHPPGREPPPAPPSSSGKTP